MTARPAECPLFGVARDLPTDQLPTYSDVIRCYKIVFDRIKLKTNSKVNPTTTDVNNQIRDDLMLLWNKARLFHTEPNSIYRKLTLCRTEYLRHLKRAKDTRTRRSEALALQAFRLKGTQLFDIAKCTCSPIKQCEYCNDIDGRDWEFLVDQRGQRMDTIKIDVHRDLGWQDKLGRRERDKLLAAIKATQAEQQQQLQQDPYVQLDDSSAISQSLCDQSDPNDPLWTDHLEPKQTDQNRTDLGDLAELAIRFENQPLSNGIVAAIGNIVMKTYKVVSEKNTKELIDQSKLGRAKDRVRKDKLEEQEQNTDPTKDLGYDSKIDTDSLETNEKLIEIESTIVKSYSTQKVSQEHYVLVDQLLGKFLKLLTVKDLDTSMKPAERIANAIIDLLGKDSLRELEALSCDGCNMNTGAHGGINRFIELILGRALQWKVCLLHGIELPLKNMVYQLDGASTSEDGFSGEIGLMMTDKKTPPYKRALVKFDPIPLVDLPPYQSQGNGERNESEDLITSKDQDLLYRMIVATSEGTVDPKLAHKKINKPSKCRWFVTANNLLRLYWSTTVEMFQKPESYQLLKTLAHFIVQVYGPMVFWIKIKWNFAWGAKHFHQLCIRSQFLLKPEHDLKYVGVTKKKKAKNTKEGEEQIKVDAPVEGQTPYEVVEKVLRRNSFYAHPESITVAMLTDDDVYVRSMAANKIREIRENDQKEEQVMEQRQQTISQSANKRTKRRQTTKPPKKQKVSSGIRVFKAPEKQLILNAPNYWQMVPWEDKEDFKWTEPPVTKQIPLDKLSSYEPPKYPCHNQRVEFYVQRASKVCAAVADEDRRNADISIGEKSRKNMPNFKNKKDFMSLV